jgi:hypothetical protein
MNASALVFTADTTEPSCQVFTNSSLKSCSFGALHQAGSLSDFLWETSLYEYILSSLSAVVFLIAATFFISSAVYVTYNLIAWYKFLAAWNLISRANRMDTAIARRRRRLSYRQMAKSHVHVECMKQTSCSICLDDFFEQDLVTPCDDGCENWFHRKCLFKWLDQSDSCPCCRKDMLTPHRRGWMAEIAAFLGFRRR